MHRSTRLIASSPSLPLRSKPWRGTWARNPGEDAALGFVVQMARCHLRNILIAAAMGDPSAQLDLMALGLAKAADFKPDSDDRTATDDHLAAFKAAGEVLH